MKHRAYWIVGGVILAGLISAIGASAIAQRRAHGNAKDMCAAIRPGITLSQANEIASKHKGQVSQTSPTESVARTSGGGLICRCRIEVTGEIISSVKEMLCLN